MTDRERAALKAISEAAARKAMPPLLVAALEKAEAKIARLEAVIQQMKAIVPYIIKWCPPGTARCPHIDHPRPCGDCLVLAAEKAVEAGQCQP